ncbi:MAG: pseudouridine synthase [Porphyromonadaceae bacterium]|nr:pseudouridine synthase [Porphyromonadaceae bacterium]
MENHNQSRQSRSKQFDGAKKRNSFNPNFQYDNFSGRINTEKKDTRRRFDNKNQNRPKDGYNQFGDNKYSFRKDNNQRFGNKHNDFTPNGETARYGDRRSNFAKNSDNRKFRSFDRNNNRDFSNNRPKFSRNNDNGVQELHNKSKSYGKDNFKKKYDNSFARNYKESDYAPKHKFYSKDFIDMNLPMRLNKFLANSNICSRREADEFISTGVISVNGQVVTELGTKIIPAKDKVHFHDQLVSMEKKIYILLNKPKNIITTSDDPKERKTVLDLIKGSCSERVYPVGRLDRNTTGVLLITNDGDLTTKLIHPKYEKKKIYHVKLDKDFEPQDMEALRNGIILEDGEIKADDISLVKEDDKKQIGIEIHSGKNRIVRRMFEHLGYKIVSLDRVYFAGLTKKNLPRGKWRYLSEQEVNFLKMNAI